MMWLWTKKIAHALAWIWLSLSAAALPATLIGQFFGDPSPIAAAIGFAVLVTGAAVMSVYAIRGGWSLKWPLLVILIMLCFPLGIGVIFIVSTIGLLKLAIWWIGRGRTVAASQMREPVISARPCGLVEYTSYD